MPSGVQDQRADAAGVEGILSRRELFDHHRQQLQESALSAEIIEARGYLTAAGPEVIKARESRFSKAQLPSKSGALMYPVFRLGTPEPYAWVTRRDRPRQSKGKDVKYEWPSNVPPIMDVLPMYRDAIRDPTVPVWITEGAKKSDSLAVAFGDSIVPVDLNGVYGWRERIEALGKVTASLSDLDEVPWQGREVVLAFDSDVRWNAGVKQALTRLGRILASKGASVMMLMLPQEKGAPKVGVDDFLAAGNTGADLLEHLQSLSEAAVVGREKFGKHPETGADLFFPAGWINTHDSIATEENGRVSIVYPGRIAVNAIGRDALTGHEAFEVAFMVGEERRRVTAPRASLATKKGIIEHLAAMGASVHDGNASKVAKFLSDFVAENLPALPTRVFSEQLGNLPGGGLLTLTGSVGESIAYTGTSIGKAGDAPAAYTDAVRMMATWEGAWPAWVALGFALASPFMARIDVRRNPVLYLAGDSNTGKTSAAAFALGAWAFPEGRPLVLQGMYTTAKGIEQTFEEVNGLPVLIDEAHAIPDPARLERSVYSFANGQTYTKGGRDGRARGGASIGGALLIAGEAVAEFRHAGSRNRVLYVEADLFPPLGTAAQKNSEVGRMRSEFLEQAWKDGAGHLGLAVAERILGGWSEFVEQVRTIRATPAFRALDDWAGSCAVMSAVLLEMFDLLDIEPPTEVLQIPAHIRAALTASRRDNPAHQSAWDQLATLITQADHQVYGEDGPVELRFKSEMIGWGDGTYWYIMPNASVVEQRLGPAAIQLHGRRWAEQGLIEPGPDGKSTMNKRCALRDAKQTRVLRIPVTALTGGPE